MRIGISLLGKHWTLLFTTSLPKGDFGSCDRPDRPGKTIKVNSRMRGRQVIETVIHECLHATDWWKDEEYVHCIAEDITKILTHPDVMKRSKIRWE